MALTLDASLLAAQTAASRHPVCSLTVQKGVDDIPFPRNPGFVPDTYNQYYASPLVLGDGRLCTFFSGNSDANQLDVLVVFSTADRTTFGTKILVHHQTNVRISGLDAIVLDANNNMGVVRQTYYGFGGLRYLTVNSAGTKIAEGVIAELTGLTGFSVVKLADNSYAVFYTRLNGSNYQFAYRTSANFTTWSAETVITIGGLTATSEVKDLRVIKLADGSYFMLFAYVTESDAGGSIYNLMCSTSADMATWAAAAAVTSSTAKSKDYTQPDVVQMADGSLFISTLESNTYLQMDINTTGWSTAGRAYEEITPVDARIDPATGKYYWIACGWGQFRGAGQVDILNWTIDQCMSGTNSPVLPAYFRSADALWGRQRGDLHLSIVVTTMGICLLDFQSDTVTGFFFYDLSGTWGADHVQNVTWTPYDSPATDPTIVAAQVDATNSRLYVMIAEGGNYNKCQFGYIDLTQVGPTYAFTELFRTTIDSQYNGWIQNMRVYPDDNMVICAGATDHSSYTGRLYVFTMSPGAIYKNYNYYAYTSFPHLGFVDAVLVGNKLWATVAWSSRHTSDILKYGLAEIDLATDIIIYHYPPFTSSKVFTIDGGPVRSWAGDIYHSATGKELIITGFGYPCVFNYESYTWEYVDYNAEGASLPGGIWYSLTYDTTNEVYVGSNTDAKLMLLPRSGSANYARYITGSYATGWTFAAPALLVRGYKNSLLSLARTTLDEIWAFWTDTLPAPDSLSWGKTGAQLDLAQYLTGETSTVYKLDGSPNELNFTVSHGHLFDPANVASIINFYLKKGNVATLRLGEKIGGTDVWADQGTFIIREVKLNYRRGTYPTAEVRCEDMRCLWEMHTVTAFQANDSYPEDAIKAVIKAHTPLTDDDFSLPTFDGRFAFDAQWLDAPLSDIVTDIANRFQYYIAISTDNKVTARKINPSAAVSNTYSTRDQLLDFTPDDSFSDLTNRVTVTGQSLDDIEVMHAEERLSQMSGTVGWYGFKKDYYVFYSTDTSRRARHPRLVVLESSTSIMFELAGKISERISYVDPYHQYCIVTVTAPNLIPVLLAAIAVYAASCAVPDYVVVGGVGASKGITIPFGRLLEKVAIVLALMVLGAIGNFQFEIWARPLGYVKRDYAASADDLDLQQQINMVVEQKHEGFLCFTAADCKSVADFELLLAQLQRNRVNYGKLAHLKDEVGDIIQVPHPYTANPVKTLVSGLTRRYKPAAGDGDGYFRDEIEGWTV